MSDTVPTDRPPRTRPTPTIGINLYSLDTKATVRVTVSEQDYAAIGIGDSTTGMIQLTDRVDVLHALLTDALAQLDQAIDDSISRPARAVLGADGSLLLETVDGRGVGDLDVGTSAGFEPGQDLLIRWVDDDDGWAFVRWVLAGDTRPAEGLVVVTVVAVEDTDG